MSRFASHACATPEPGMGEWSIALRDLLGRFTAFPWALITAVCRRHGCDPRALTRSEIEAMIPAIALAVASFNEVDDGFRVKRELLVMLRTSG
ncbi:MAG TPA: hypothetical protein VFG69_00830 [Nannocystaceae bacterium]|nr:hypothetical protein [Nannocystaceae bacterium]